ncbi:MAG: ankyrin repeat domain-containing protein [Verrucomicrobia bacterium]|nr:ankyrin repeat domain-containing protein [Verrucomicrobiota bacterium]
MATVSRGLPQRPHLDVPKREARDLLKECRAAKSEALDRIRRRHPKFRSADPAAITVAGLRLSDAQMVIAREYGFANWAQLKERINSNTVVGLLHAAIRADDRDTVVRLLRANPKLLHVPVRSGNWGPPMSHAANLGQLEMIKAIAALGARDFQHAFDRALLQGELECAKWLHEHGAKLTPGIVMGACETLNPDGLRFLDELNAPFTDERGNQLAPLALALETYCRNPAGKHEVLQIFARRGYALPDTPILAFHRGDVDRLKEYLRRDPALLHRRFSCREIYPPQLGCSPDGRSGMHGTPLEGATLLHMAIDFEEQETFDLLLAEGSDVNARAGIDAGGFGGHTPLFNAVVNCGCPGQAAVGFAQKLLCQGASPNIRATLRKFLDWCEEPRWHEARNVTPAEWGRSFPEKGWVNLEALRLVDAASHCGSG